MSSFFVPIFGIILFIFLGCGDAKKVDYSDFSSGKEVSATLQTENESLDKKTYAGLENVFQDTSEISNHRKFLMMVFAKNNCPYCEELKADIRKSKDLQEYIVENFSPYYINIDYQKVHHYRFGDSQNTQEIDIPTSRLATEVYQIYVTPTIIFNDLDGRIILEVPGYLGSDKFKETMEFVVSRKWEHSADVRERMKLLYEYLEKKQ